MPGGVGEAGEVPGGGLDRSERDDVEARLLDGPAGVGPGDRHRGGGDRDDGAAGRRHRRPVPGQPDHVHAHARALLENGRQHAARQRELLVHHEHDRGLRRIGVRHPLLDQRGEARDEPAGVVGHRRQHRALLAGGVRQGGEPRPLRARGERCGQPKVVRAVQRSQLDGEPPREGRRLLTRAGDADAPDVGEADGQRCTPDDEVRRQRAGDVRAVLLGPPGASS